MTEVSRPLQGTEYTPQPVRKDLETETLRHPLGLWPLWSRGVSSLTRDLQMRKLRHGVWKCPARSRTEAGPGLMGAPDCLCRVLTPVY